MKKVFLSAVMMMAFSGVSMANCIVEKEVEPIRNSVELKENPCFLTAFKMMDIVEAETGTIDDIVEYYFVYQYYVDMCNRGGLKLK